LVGVWHFEFPLTDLGLNWVLDFLDFFVLHSRLLDPALEF
jgi:hypothetical protein